MLRNWRDELSMNTSTEIGVAQNETTGVTQVLVFGSICQGAILVHVCDPRPDVCSFKAPNVSLLLLRFGFGGGHIRSVGIISCISLHYDEVPPMPQVTLERGSVPQGRQSNCLNHLERFPDFNTSRNNKCSSG